MGWGRCCRLNGEYGECLAHDSGSVKVSKSLAGEGDAESDDGGDGITKQDEGEVATSYVGGSTSTRRTRLGFGLM